MPPKRSSTTATTVVTPPGTPPPQSVTIPLTLSPLSAPTQEVAPTRITGDRLRHLDPDYLKKLYKNKFQGKEFTSSDAAIKDLVGAGLTYYDVSYFQLLKILEREKHMDIKDAVVFCLTSTHTEAPNEATGAQRLWTAAPVEPTPLRTPALSAVPLQAVDFGEVEVPAYRLFHITKESLQKTVERTRTKNSCSYKMPKRPTKWTLVAVLRQSQLKYKDLIESEMERMLDQEDQQIPLPNDKTNLFAELERTHRDGECWIVYEALLSAWRSNGSNNLKSTQYSIIMQEHGLSTADMQGCHIIAQANGGADHPDNYICLSGALNSLLLNHGDDLMCYFVGQERAKRAVEASKKYGEYNTKQKGLSADKLYSQGESRFKAMWEEYKKIAKIAE